MTPTLIIELARSALLTIMLVAGPLLGVALVVGLLISVIQAVTQIQEQTLSFVPKFFAVGGVIAFAMPWMLRVLIQFTREIFLRLPSLTP